MKKTFLKLIAIITMLFAFSSCDALLGALNNLEENDQDNTEQEGKEKEPEKDKEKPSEEETKVPTSLADFAGTALVYREDPDWYYNYYMYVKDADTIVTCSKKNETGEYWISEDKVQEDGSFWSDALTWSFKIKVVAGKLILYRSNVYYEKDIYADVKKDETEGLYGTWEFEDAAAERPYPKTYVITKETFSYDECGYEDYDEKNATTKSYTLDDGLLISDGEVFAYYDGTSLYTIGVLELKKVSEETLAEEIKKHAIDPDKDDDEGDEETNSATLKIDDVVGNVYYLQSNSDSTINDIQVNLYHVDNSTTITQFYRNSSYYDNDLLIKEWTNNIQENGMDFSYSYYDGDQNRISTDAKTLNYAIYDNSIILYDTGDSFPLTKTSGGDGLYGTWEVTFEYYKWGEYWPETVKLEIDESTANFEKYTNENGYIIIKHGEGWNASYESFYYDGKTVYREPYKLAKVTDLRKIRAIKSELGVLEKDPVPQNVNDLTGKYYFFQVNPRYTHDNHSRNAAYYLHVNSDLSADIYQVREDWDLLASKEGTYNLEGDTIPTTCFYSPLKIRFTSNNVFCCKENSDREPEAYEKVDGKEGLIGEWKCWNYSMVIEEENGVLVYKDRWDTYEITNDDGFLTVRNKENGDGSFWYYDGEKIYTEREYCLNLLQVFDQETIDLLDNTTEQIILFK